VRISATNNNNVTNPANGFVRSGILSYMGRVNYTFNDKYSLTGTFREMVHQDWQKEINGLIILLLV
jgi:hypothetical protein